MDIAQSGLGPGQRVAIENPRSYRINRRPFVARNYSIVHIDRPTVLLIYSDAKRRHPPDDIQDRPACTRAVTAHRPVLIRSKDRRRSITFGELFFKFWRRRVDTPSFGCA